MAILSEVTAAEALVDLIGFRPAMALFAFFGRTGGRLHVPQQADPKHPIAAVVGAEAMQKLCQRHGGQAVYVPALELAALRRAGLVFRAGRAGVPAALTADLLGVAASTVAGIKERLRLEGVTEVAELFTEDEA